MKKTILFFTTLALTVNMYGQQLPMFSELYFMRLLYNPALTGYNGSTNLYGFYRNQWVNVPGHPVTSGVVGDISLWKDRCAVGFSVYSDNTDIIHNINAQVYYAQKIHLAKDHILSLGVTLGIIQSYIDFNNAVPTDLNDPHLLLNGKEGIAFNMNIGLAYQWKKLTIGFSVPQVLNSYVPVSSQELYSTFSLQRLYIGSASYEFSFADEKFNIEPTVQVKKAASEPLQVDAGFMANYKRMFYLGAGYSLNYGVAIMAAVRVAKVVTIGYAYDVPVLTGVTFQQTKGTNELTLGINFDKWTKKKNKKDNQQFAKQSLVDSLMAKQDTMQKQLDSLAQVTDSIQIKQANQQKVMQAQQDVMDEQQKTVQDQQKTIKDMQQQVDSFDNVVKQYKKTVAAHPAKNFPSKIGKDTKGNKGDVFRLSNVSFEKNSSFLNQSSFGELDKVIEFMKNNPEMQIRINGHTDYKASAEYNQWLSDRRAKRVYDYLVEQGAPADRLSYVGFGSKLPIGDNTTEEGRAKNRRVEIEVLK